MIICQALFVCELDVVNHPAIQKYTLSRIKIHERFHNHPNPQRGRQYW